MAGGSLQAGLPSNLTPQAICHPDELRISAGGPRAEVYRQGLTEELLAQLRARPEVAAAEMRNGHLELYLLMLE
jgi:hypothetical protein